MKKNALRSKTIVGILTAIAGHAGLAGQIIPDPTLAAKVDAALSILGYILALYGRFVAKGGLSLMPTETPAPPA